MAVPYGKRFEIAFDEMFPEGAYLIGEVLYEHTKDLDIDAIGGLEVGAVPLTPRIPLVPGGSGAEVHGVSVSAVLAA